MARIQDLRRGFSQQPAMGLPPIPVQADPSIGPTSPGMGGPEWDASWEKRARKILGSKVGTYEDLMDPEHRKWINRKLRKHRQRSTTTPKKPGEASTPAAMVEPVEPATVAKKPVSQGPIVRPGHIVRRALKPEMQQGGTRGPRRGYSWG